MENKCLESGGAAWEEGGGNTPGGTPRRLGSSSLHSGLGVSRPAPTGICGNLHSLPIPPLPGPFAGQLPGGHPDPNTFDSRRAQNDPHTEP